MTTAESLINILLRALHEREQRPELVKKFQEIVWNDPLPHSDEGAWHIFGDLAYDLDFYVPDEGARKEDPAYFGDNRLEEEIRSVLDELKRRGQLP